MIATSSYAQSIEAHYARNWSAPDSVIRWEKGPVSDLPTDFGILRIKRSHEMLAFATRCMSQPSDEARLELHALCAPEHADDAHLVEILTAVTHYHRTHSKLGHGHTVNFGMPWIDGSACTHGLLSLPYLDGPDLEWLPGQHIRFLWLIPITPAELQLKKTRGLEALEQRFEEMSFNFLDPFRSSVA